MARATLNGNVLRLGDGKEYQVGPCTSFTSTEDEYIVTVDGGDGWVRTMGSASQSLWPDKRWRITAKPGVHVTYESASNTLGLPKGNVRFQQAVAEVLQSKRIEELFIVLLRGGDSRNILAVDSSGKELWRIGDPPAPWKAIRPYYAAYNDSDGTIIVEGSGFRITLDPSSGQIQKAVVSR